MYCCAYRQRTCSISEGWSDKFRPDFASVFEDRQYLERILDIGRSGQKPRKDHVYAEQII